MNAPKTINLIISGLLGPIVGSLIYDGQNYLMCIAVAAALLNIINSWWIE